MNAFEQYLAWHEIDLITLSVAAKVRYLTIWNAKKGHPITLENAQKIRQAVLKLTGTPYDGSFVLQKSPTKNGLPNFPMRKLYKL
jgi:hypothetical protein